MIEFSSEFKLKEIIFILINLCSNKLFLFVLSLMTIYTSRGSGQFAFWKTNKDCTELSETLTSLFHPNKREDCRHVCPNFQSQWRVGGWGVVLPYQTLTAFSLFYSLRSKQSIFRSSLHLIICSGNFIYSDLVARAHKENPHWPEWKFEKRLSCLLH